MALTLYIGSPGSGKSYEVVKSVIVPALKAGRFVVTNVDGFDREKLADDLDCDPDRVMMFSDAQFADEASYPILSDPAARHVIPHGALVVIDEAYNSFGTEKGMVTKRMIEFVRTHRHFVDEKTGVATDIVMISQDVMGLASRVRSVAEFVYYIRSLKFLPFMKKRYRFTSYASAKMTKAGLLRSEVRKYEPWVFKYYKSYKAGAGARQVLTDKSMMAWRWWHYLLFGSLLLFAIWAVKGCQNTRDFMNGRGAHAAALSAPGAECKKSGQLVDLDTRKYLKNGEWHAAGITKLDGGGERWQLGGCWIEFRAELRS